MPLAASDLKTSFIEVTPDESVGNMLRRLPAERKERLGYYVVAPVGDGRFVVVDWGQLEALIAAAAGTPEERAWLTLQRLIPQPEPVAAFERGKLSLGDAKFEAERQPGKRIVVLESGAVLGIFTMRTLNAAVPSDPFAGNTRFDVPSVVLSEEATAAEAPPAAETPAQPPSPAPEAKDDRVFNAWIADGEQDTPLQLGQTYELCFNVDRPRAASVAAVAFDAAKAFAGLPPDVREVEVTVAIDSEDFTIHGDDQATLKVPRVGKSKNTVRFTIEAKHNGPGVVSAVFIARNRIFQKMEITLQVGSLAAGAPTWKERASGLSMAGPMLAARPNTVNLVIERRDAGYRVRLFNGVSVPPATLNVSETQLAELLLYARDVLKEIVYLKTPSNQYAYQSADTSIPPEIHRETLVKLAKLGFYLYQKLFFAPGNGIEAQNLGRQLRLFSQQKQLQITIVAERFIFPWALLYDREKVDPENVDPSGFWGFKHVVEYRPEFSSPTPVSFFPEIAADKQLKLGFVCNTAIDEELTRKGFGPVVKPQSEYFRTLDGVDVTEYPNRADLIGKLLGNPDSPEQIIYFYCHAVSTLPGEAGGVAASKFILSDGPVMLRDLDMEAPIDAATALSQSPLVFLNACQSAELSPLLYDGLIPYLVGKGIRGVIGTEVDTPALFAAEFAKEFLKRFTAGGRPLGDLLLEMRREYLEKKNNVMGLLYALYSCGDVVVQRG